MLVKVFETKNENIGMEGDIDEQIIQLLQKYGNKLKIKKFNVLDKKVLEKNKDVRKYVEENGIESLPIAKINNNLISFSDLDSFLDEKIG